MRAIYHRSDGVFDWKRGCLGNSKLKKIAFTAIRRRNTRWNSDLNWMEEMQEYTKHCSMDVMYFKRSICKHCEWVVLQNFLRQNGFKVQCPLLSSCVQLYPQLHLTTTVWGFSRKADCSLSFIFSFDCREWSSGERVVAAYFLFVNGLCHFQ